MAAAHVAGSAFKAVALAETTLATAVPTATATATAMPTATATPTMASAAMIAMLR
jgi:hypothetical protein